MVRGPRLVFLQSIVALVMVVVALQQAGCVSPQERSAAEGPPSPAASAEVAGSAVSSWEHFAGQDLTALAWSPDGKRLAFVATPPPPPIAGFKGSMSAWGEIWLLALPTQPDAPRLRRLARLSADKDQGIPTALFWMSDTRVGWAAEDSTGGVGGFTFFALGLGETAPQRIVPCGFVMAQMRGEGENEAPDDVYWEPREDSGALWFTAQGDTMRNDVSGEVLCFYDVASNAMRPTILPPAEGVATFCLTLQNDAYTLYYTDIEPGSSPYVGRIWAISLNDGGNSRREVLIRHKGFVWFPRASADGRQLAYLFWPERQAMEMDRLVVHDLATSTERTVAQVSSSGMTLGLGCPYCWSPSGYQIAYSTGSSIRIVDASAESSPDR